MKRKSRNILIASVLKPVNDSRSYEKIALSINKLSKYNIHIIGQNIPTQPAPAGITFHPIFKFQRLGLQRLIAPLLFFIQQVKLKPAITIIGTHELLWPAVIYKLVSGNKLIYDVQENYFYNILYTNSFPKILKGLIGNYVRFKEWICSIFVSYFLLAEKAYALELPFIKERFTILENKYKPLKESNINQQRGYSKLLYSGTIAENYGIWDAINLATKLHGYDNNIRLHIIGYCSDLKLLNNLKKAISEKPFISLTGGDALVPHEQIIEAIEEADFGLVCYKPNPSTNNCIPTKLYEYLYNRLPLLLTPNPVWVDFSSAYNAVLLVDYNQINAYELIKKMQSSAFFDRGDFSQLLWESNEQQLIELVLI